MNAIQFIQKHGVDKAREVVSGAPFNSTCYVFWTGKFRYINELTCEIYSEKLGGWCEANIMVLNLKNPLSELKRLVESVDLIGKYHSIDHAKNHYNNMREALNQYQYENKDIEDLSNELEQAIADYESIYCVADIEKCEFELGLAPDEQYVKSGGEHV